MKYIEQDIKKCLFEHYLPYAVSVITERAIVEIDGLKCSHRKLLYTMYKMGLLNGSRTKCANIVGQTMGLNPHGDSAIYETLVRLTKDNESLNIPFINSKGNFGKVFSRDMAYAASRYTEAKLSDISKELFKGIDNEAVDMVDNYDNTKKEPTLLPVTFPSIICNVNQGIAVGISSNICSFNINEVIDYTIDTINNKCTNILTPDFSTGGYYIYNDSELKSINQYGRGSISVRAKYKFDKQANCIDIYEIPYTTTVEAIIDKIEELVKNGKIKEIADVRDESDLSGLKLTIDLKRNIDADNFMLKLFKMTPLEDKFSCNFNILIDGYPKLLGVKSIVEEWIKFRQTCIQREYAYDIKQFTQELNKLKGLSIILSSLDKAIQIIRKSKSEQEAIDNLILEFSINQEQAEYISSIKLINMNEQWINNKVSRISELESKIIEYNSIISDDNKINEIIISQLEYVKKTYGQPRKTTIIYQDDIVEVKKDDLIEDYNCQIVVTNNYIKKTLKYSDSQKLKDGDKVLQQFQSNNKNKLLLITDKCNGYMIKVSDLDSATPSTLGQYLYNIAPMDKDENVIYCMNMCDNGYLLIGFENGKVAKIDAKSYSTNNKKVTNVYNQDSPIVFIKYIEKETRVGLISSIDKLVVYNTSNINSKGSKKTQGVNIQKSKNDSYVVKMFDESDVEIEDGVLDYYEVKQAGTGCYIKKEHKEIFSGLK